jgi:hypothetical protein
VAVPVRNGQAKRRQEILSWFPIHVPESERWGQLGIKPDKDGAMTEPQITHGSIRKLASMLGGVDTSAMKHAERIDLIASSMGWRGDALMHALKVAGNELTPGELASQISLIGISGLETWVPSLVSRSKGAIFLVCGALGARPSATCRAIVSAIKGGGRIDLGELSLDGGLPAACSDGIVFGRAKSELSIQRAVRHADGGAIVLLYMVASSVASGYLEFVAGLEQSRADSLDLVRGVLVQTIVGGSSGERIVVAECLSMENPNQKEYVLNPPPAPWFAAFGMARDALSYVEAGRISIDEVRRVFRVADIEQRVESVIQAYPALATKPR